MLEKEYENKEMHIKDNPLISVIIPVYNVSRYLGQCIDSVIQQTYKNLEIIIIDDGSTDDSGIISDQFAFVDSRIKVFHTENKGLSSARNLGIDNANGLYLSFLDSDDWMGIDAIELLLNAAKETGAEIVASNFCYEYVNKIIHRKSDKNRLQIFHGDEILSNFADGLFSDVIWNKLYHNNCFNNIRFPIGHKFEDIFVTWQYIKKMAEEDKTLVFISEELFHYRVRENSISRTSSFNNIVDCWNAYLAKYNGLIEYQKHLISDCFLSIGRMWNNYSGFSREEKTKAKETINEMQSFSKNNRTIVLKSEFSRIIRLICIISQTKSSFMMRLCFCIGKAHKHRMRKKEKKVMFE